MELKLDDLFGTCQRCSGSGNINETAPTGQAFGFAKRKTVGDCPDCNRKGGSYTPAGEVLRQFVLQMKGSH